MPQTFCVSYCSFFSKSHQSSKKQNKMEIFERASRKYYKQQQHPALSLRKVKIKVDIVNKLNLPLAMTSVQRSRPFLAFLNASNTLCLLLPFLPWIENTWPLCNLSIQVEKYSTQAQVEKKMMPLGTIYTLREQNSCLDWIFYSVFLIRLETF